MEIEKISFAQYEGFSRDYHFCGKYPNLRFGQAFMNHFYPNISDPNLYYAQRKDAVQMIFDRYIDWKSEE